MNRGVGGGKPPLMSGPPTPQQHLQQQQQSPMPMMMTGGGGQMAGQVGSPLPGSGMQGHGHMMSGAPSPSLMTHGAPSPSIIPHGASLNPMMPHPPQIRAQQQPQQLQQHAPTILQHLGSSHPGSPMHQQQHQQQHQQLNQQQLQQQLQQQQHNQQQLNQQQLNQQINPNQQLNPHHQQHLTQQQQHLTQQQQQLLLAQQQAAFNQPITILARFAAEYIQEIVSRTLDLFQQLRTVASNNPAMQEEKKGKIKEFARLMDIYFGRLRRIYVKCDQNFHSQLENGGVVSEDEILEAFIPLGDDSEEEEVDSDDKDEDQDTKKNILFSINDSKECEDNKQTPEPITPTPTQSITSQSLASELLNKINTHERNRNNPKIQALEQEYQDLLELNQLKSKQLKEIIDRSRKLVWDINTMLAMRKPT